MGILIRSKKRVKKLQYGGSVPVYGDYNYIDAKQSQYNPLSLLKKYKQSPAASGGKAPKEKDLGLEGLENDNAQFYDKYEQLKADYSKGVAGNEFYDETERGIKNKRDLDRHTTLGVQEVKNRKEAFGLSKAAMNTNKTSDQWVYKNGEGLMRAKRKDGSYAYMKVPGSALYKAMDQGWEKVSASNLLIASEHDSRMAGTEWMEDVRGLMNNKDSSSAMDSVFKDIGSKTTGNKTTYDNVTVDIDTLSKVAKGNLNVTNEPKLKIAFDTMLMRLEGPAIDSIKARAYESSTTPAEAEDKVNSYLASQWLKRVTTLDKYQTKTNLDDKKDGSGAGKGDYKGWMGPILFDVIGGQTPNNNVIEFPDGITKDKSVSVNMLEFPMPAVNDWMGTYKNAATGVLGRSNGIKVLDKIADTGKTVLAAGPNVKLDSITTYIDIGVDLGISKGREGDMSKTSIISSERPPTRVFMPYDTNNNIVNITAADYKEYDEALKQHKSNFELKTSTSTTRGAELWRASKRSFTNTHFKNTKGLTGKKIQARPTILAYAVASDWNLDEKYLKYGSAVDISTDDLALYKQKNPKDAGVVMKPGDDPNPEISASKENFYEFPIFMPIRHFANANFADFNKTALDNNKFNLEDIQSDWSNQHTTNEDGTKINDMYSFIQKFRNN